MAGGFVAASAFLLGFRGAGYLPTHLGAGEILWKALAASIVGTAVESLPIAEVDNLTVAVSSAATAWWLFGF